MDSSSSPENHTSRKRPFEASETSEYNQEVAQICKRVCPSTTAATDLRAAPREDINHGWRKLLRDEQNSLPKGRPLKTEEIDLLEREGRAHISELLLRTNRAYAFNAEIFGMAVGVADKSLLLRAGGNKELKLMPVEAIAAAALTISCKFLEDSLRPLVCDLATCFNTTSDLVLEAEIVVLKALDWRLHSVSAHSCLHHLMHFMSKCTPSSLSGNVGAHAEYYVDKCLINCRSLRFTPSQIALQALFEAVGLWKAQGNKAWIPSHARRQTPELVEFVGGIRKEVCRALDKARNDNIRQTVSPCNVAEALF